MVAVFALVGWIGVKAGMALLDAHAQANQELQLVSQTARENHRLEAQEKALSQRATIIRDARALGMVRVGERPYVVVGLK